MTDQVMNRGLGDILKAERDLREIAEGQNRALRGALKELAYRLAGEELEELRRSNPEAPDNWTADDWRKFFAKHQTDDSGWIKPDVLQSRLRTVEQERDTAIQELEKVFLTINEKLKNSAMEEGDSPFEGVTDEDIDEIFGD